MAESRSPQLTWLGALLAREAGGAYLRDCGAPQSLAAFRAQVPMVTHADLQPALARMAAGEGDVLFMGQPVAWERTAGSSAGAKRVPYSAAGLADMRAVLGPWISGLLAQHLGDGPEGQLYLALSPALRTPETLAGVPVGMSDAAYLGDALGAQMLPRLAVPPSVALAPDVASWRAATLRHLMAAPHLRLISVWSPTFLLMLLDALALRGENPLTLWPALRLISCWDSAASAPYADELRRRLPQAQLQGKGLMATEGVVTVPNALGQTELAQRGFFEFLHAGELLLPHALQPDVAYEVVMTTASGLYRYRTGDVVRCTGWAGNDSASAPRSTTSTTSAISTAATEARQPVLRFDGRLGVHSDLVGEKLNDAFVAPCLAPLPGTRFLVPDAAERCYRLLSDRPVSARSLAALELALQANPQYAYARSLGQLKALTVRTMPDLSQRLERVALANGGRLADIKPLGLRVGNLQEFE